MWRRFRRRTLGPRRPMLWEGQYGLAALTAVVLLASVAFVVWGMVR